MYKDELFKKDVLLSEALKQVTLAQVHAYNIIAILLYTVCI